MANLHDERVSLLTIEDLFELINRSTRVQSASGKPQLTVAPSCTYDRCLTQSCFKHCG